MNKIQSLAQALFFTCCIMFVGQSSAAVAQSSAAAAQITSESPYILIEQVAAAIFKRINSDQSLIEANPNHLKVVVKEELMPYINHRFAARVVLSRVPATDEEKETFYLAFEQYLITTYATVFAQYSDQKVSFGAKEDYRDKKMVTVSSKVINPGNESLDIDFIVLKNKTSAVWQVVDLRAMGVSLLDTKKAELKGLLLQKDGVNHVAQLLTEKANANITVDNKS